MDYNIINEKMFNNPSFFWISNLGGGGSDKYRETVYLDLYDGIPTLYNYYYLKYPSFANKWLRNIENYQSFGDFLKYVRESMINEENFICEKHDVGNYNYSQNVYLLDSGARNILNDMITGKIPKNGTIENSMIERMKEYYDFADKYKFDFVIGFDVGGKYTFKDNETKNNLLNEELENIDFDLLNKKLFTETIKYLKDNPSFYPRVFATVHGDTPTKYSEYIKFIVEVEEEQECEFYGYALGGVASSKQADESWFTGFENSKLKNTYLVTKATQIVKAVVGNKPIHVLGGGNKDNIPSLVMNGATSYDCQTPGRRAYDGNEKSTELVFEVDAKESFSKYLPALIDNEFDHLNEELKFDYASINKLKDNLELCDCPACKQLTGFDAMKELYSLKKESNEYYYYARQLMNAHSVWQHYFLSLLVSSCDSYEKLLDVYPFDFFVCLKDIFE